MTEAHFPIDRFIEVNLSNSAHAHAYKHIETLLNPSARKILEDNNFSKIYYFYMHACIVEHYIDRFLNYYHTAYGTRKLQRSEAILLDCSLEGNYQVDEVMKRLCAELEADRYQLIVVSQSRVMEGPQSTVFYNQAHYDIVTDKSRELIDTAMNNRPDDSKPIICLNNKPRPHRIALVAYLVSKGLHLNNYISFTSVDESSKQDLDRYAKNALRVHRSLQEEINAFLNESSSNHLVIPEPEDGNGNIIYSEGTPWNVFAGSKFSIITESEFHAKASNPDVRVTEKVYKSIAVGHPFILVGIAESLKHLRELGFSTFKPFINEDYDIPGSEDERMLRVCKSIDLMLSDLETNPENYDTLSKLGSYNRRHLMSGGLHQRVVDLYNSTLSEFFTYWRE